MGLGADSLPKSTEDADLKTKKFKVTTATDGSIRIPLEMLSPENPVLYFDEVVLYEDELADRGSSKSYVRFRIMADCWFVLLRSYVRIDKVAVRILDTRVFHKFSEPSKVIRDFTYLEDTWHNLLAKGFNLDYSWLNSPFQSDQIYESLEKKMTRSELIEF